MQWNDLSPNQRSPGRKQASREQVVADDSESFKRLKYGAIPENLASEFNSLHLGEVPPTPIPTEQYIQLSFMKEAMIDIYNVRYLKINDDPLSDEKLILIGNIYESSISLSTFETQLCQCFDVRFKNLSEPLGKAIKNHYSIKWKCHVIINQENPNQESFDLKFITPEVDSSTTLYHHKFGSLRFLYAMVITRSTSSSSFKTGKEQPLSKFPGMTKLFEKGITFANRTFHFLGGELVNYKAVARIMNKSKQNNDVQWNGINGWFVNESAPYLENLQAVNLRDYLGYLSIEKPGKCNARLKLGFSNVFPFPISDDCIEVIPDISNSANPKKVMTDGCGFIGFELARKIPYGIVQGNMQCEREADMPVAAFIQVRCASTKGLFKGCLLVTQDEGLCPKGKIFFRESMKKAPGSPLYPNPNPILGIAKTFEKPRILQSGRRVNKADYSIKLNKETCLLLQFLKVPAEYFTDILKRELMSLMNCLNSREDARKLIKQVIKQSRNQSTDVEDEIEEEFLDTLDEETDCTIINDDDDESTLMAEPDRNSQNEPDESFYSNSIDQAQDLKMFSNNLNKDMAAAAEMVRSLMMVGMTLEEIHVKKLFNQIVTQRFDDLFKFQLQITNAIFLVGAPDPYGHLGPDEVFIALPNDRKEIFENAPFLNLKRIEGKVVVTRHPLTHPGDIRTFKAVPHPALEKYSISCSNGGIIVFSTQGDRAPADKMSGGDYDGDLYLIIYNDEDGLLDHIQAIEPCEDDEEDKAPNSQQSFNDSRQGKVCTHNRGEMCRVCSDCLGVCILTSLLENSQNHSVGNYSNAWLKWSDRDPLSREAKECGRIKKIALDAPKTGKSIPENKRLLYDAPIPHWQNAEKNGISHATTSPTNASPLSSTGSPASSSEEKNSPFANYSPRHLYTQKQKREVRSTSILGELYDLAFSMNIAFQEKFHQKMLAASGSTNISKNDTILTDFDCIVVFELDFGPENNITRDWRIPETILRNYCPSKQKDFKLYSPQELLRNILPSLSPQMKDIMDWFITPLKNYKKQFCEILNQRQLSNYEKNNKTNDLKYKSYQAYLDLIQRMKGQYPQIPERLLRLRIAGISYLCTYAAAADKGTESISYCWELCGKELLFNKNQVYLRRNQYSIYDPISPQEIINWA